MSKSFTSLRRYLIDVECFTPKQATLGIRCANGVDTLEELTNAALYREYSSPLYLNDIHEMGEIIEAARIIRDLQ
jgi:hypothetical protein